MKQCDLTKGLVVFLTIMITFFCGVMPSAWAEDDVEPKCKYCEDQKFKGCYGFSHDGMMMMRIFDPITGAPIDDDEGNPVFSDPPVPMASVGMFSLTDDGKLIGREMVNFGGVFFPARLRGTYTVRPNCTGTAWICATPINSIPPNDIPIRSRIDFVLVGHHLNKIQMVTNKMTVCGSGGVVVAKPLNIVGTAKKQICDDQQ